MARKINPIRKFLSNGAGKTIPWFLILAMVVLLGAGFYFQVPKVKADTAATTATVGNVAPTVSDVSLNSQANFAPVENTIKSVNITGKVVDTNGAAECTTISAIAYRSGVSSTCAANDNDCYRGVTCSTSASGTVINCTCAVSIWFHGDPTDAGDYVAQWWTGSILATDTSSATGIGSSAASAPELTTLRALDVTTSIAYSTVAPGADTGATNQNVTVTTTGNAAIDCSVKGTDMTGGVDGTILASKQKYDLATFTYSSGGTAFAAKDTDAALELVCAKPTAHPSNSSDIVFWGLGVDAGTPTGSYTGTNTFTVTAD